MLQFQCQVRRSFLCGKELFIICTHIYICICEKLFTTKKTIFESGIVIARSFSGMVLNACWKRALQMDLNIYRTCVFALYVAFMLHQSNIQRHIKTDTALWQCTYSWRRYSATPLGEQATSIIIQFSTQSHYPDADLSIPCHVIVMSSARPSLG